MDSRNRLLVAFLVVTCLGQVNAGLCFGRPFAPSRTRIAAEDPFGMGRRVGQPRTPGMPRRELIRRTAGRVREVAYLKYGDFGKYWAAVAKSRSGKVFEALVADASNRRFAGLRHGDHVLVTAAERAPAHPADLARINRLRRVVERRQLKSNLKSLGQAHKVLTDSRYKGMTIETTQDSLDRLLLLLKKEKAKATRRGIPLGRQAQIVEDAFASGQLATWSIGGGPLLSERRVLAATKREIRMQWEEVGQKLRLDSEREVLVVTKRETSIVWRKAGRKLRLDKARQFRTRVFRIGGRVLVIADVAVIGHAAYMDVQIYRRGMMRGGYLVARSANRGTQVVLLYYAMFSPEPMTKTLAGIGVLGLAAGGMTIDYFLAEEREALARTLEHVEMDERFQLAAAAIRHQVRKPATQVLYRAPLRGRR